MYLSRCLPCSPELSWAQGSICRQWPKNLEICCSERLSIKKFWSFLPSWLQVGSPLQCGRREHQSTWSFSKHGKLWHAKDCPMHGLRQDATLYAPVLHANWTGEGGYRREKEVTHTTVLLERSPIRILFFTFKYVILSYSGQHLKAANLAHLTSQMHLFPQCRIHCCNTPCINLYIFQFGITIQHSPAGSKSAVKTSSCNYFKFSISIFWTTNSSCSCC